MPESVSMTSPAPASIVREVFVRVKSASCDSTSVSMPSPPSRISALSLPSSTSFPRPPVRVSAPSLPINVSSPSPPDISTLPMNAEASIMLPLRPPVRSAFSIFTNVFFSRTPSVTSAVIPPPVRLVPSTVMSGMSFPPEFTMKVMVQGPCSSERSRPSNIDSTPEPSMPRSAAAVESFNASTTMLPVPPAVSVISITVLSEFRSAERFVCASVMASSTS